MLIARATGWARSENDELRKTLVEVLRLAEARDDMALARIGRLAADCQLTEASEVFTRLPQKVAALLEKPDFFVAEAVQRLVVRLAQQSRDDEAARVAQLALARIHETKSEQTKSAMLKTHALQEAIDTLHGVKGVREERQRLHERLKEAQLHMMNEFGSFEHSLDLTDEVKRILSGYEGLDLLEALKRLALTELPRDPEKLIKQAQEEAQRFPLPSLFSTSIIDNKGRVVARSGGGIENEETLRHKVIQHEHIRIGIAIAGAIGPARQWLTENFDVSQKVFYELCLISPFVPSGTEHAFARGMQAFIYGDDYLAAASLVPLLESGLRAMVATAGRSDTKISAGGIEATIGLGPLLSEHRHVLEAVFGKGMIFCIENVFSHELGPKIRHSYCHGLTHDSTFYSSEYVYGCKLIFSLVLLPIIGASWDAVKDHVQKRVEVDRL